jgi:hypothetical protein
MIRVKFLSRLSQSEWPKYFPAEDFVWKSCRFIFDRDARDYDWLVVYDELPPAIGRTQKTAEEVLACPVANTLLVTTEPSSIKAYGRHYTQQFGHVLTTQAEWALPHAQRHWQQAANHWFYGSNPAAPMAHQRLLAGPGPKTGMASMVGSNKANRHTQHAARFAFMQRVQVLMPELEVFGRGYRPLDNKADALDAYRYHICLENHVATHHWTEKLSDAFLGRCLPFYAGAPNASVYFPEGSFVPIDIKNPEAAVALLRQAMAEGWYEQRLPLIEEARRRVLEEYHLFAVIEGIVAAAPVISGTMDSVAEKIINTKTMTIYSRHALRRRSLFLAIYHGFEKLHIRLRSMLERIV